MGDKKNKYMFEIGIYMFGLGVLYTWYQYLSDIPMPLVIIITCGFCISLHGLKNMID